MTCNCCETETNAENMRELTTIQGASSDGEDPIPYRICLRCIFHALKAARAFMAV